jgi:hypothetical protein
MSLIATPLDPTRRPLTDRVGVQKQRDHHGRIMCRTTPAVVAVVRVERGEIHLLDGVEHEPCQMPLGQPFTQARRQQPFLIAVARQDVLAHRMTPADRRRHHIAVSAPDSTNAAAGRVCATASYAGPYQASRGGLGPTIRRVTRAGRLRTRREGSPRKYAISVAVHSCAFPPFPGVVFPRGSRGRSCDQRATAHDRRPAWGADLTSGRSRCRARAGAYPCTRFHGEWPD